MNQNPQTQERRTLGRSLEFDFSPLGFDFLLKARKENKELSSIKSFKNEIEI